MQKTLSPLFEQLLSFHIQLFVFNTFFLLLLDINFMNVNTDEFLLPLLLIGSSSLLSSPSLMVGMGSHLTPRMEGRAG